MSSDYKSINEIHDTMLNNISDEYQKTEGFPTYDLTRGEAFALLELWKKTHQIEVEQDVENLSGDKLNRYTFQRKGIARKDATCSEGLLTVLDGQGTINKGTLFESDGGLFFEAVETKTVNKNDTFLVRSQTAGHVGNVGARSINKIPITIPGINQVTNMSAFGGGFDAESDKDLRDRYYVELRYPASSGNKNHYRKWALEVPGVGNAKAISLWNGDNTVKIVIINSDRQPADKTLIDKVQNYIDPNKSGTGEGQAPIGAYCTVVSATALPINVSLTATLQKTTNKVVAQKEIEDVIYEYLKEIAFNQDFVSYAEIGARIILLDSVIDYDKLLVNGGVNKIPVGPEEVATRGMVTLN